MINYTTGNLLESGAEALVNTVNTVGVMGKGIALMFKDRFDDNYKQYSAACKEGRVQTGRIFVTQPAELDGPKWVINFPTKRHWRSPSQIEWITEGLHDLRNFLIANRVRSLALPPLGSGNGGLDWNIVKIEIEKVLADLDVEIIVYEPTSKYQNVAKREGLKTLTPARALIAELVRRYWVLGMECSLLEVQKLAWLLERVIEVRGLKNPLDLRFEANRYGPYADRLRHLLNGLDGSYLHCDKRLNDAGPLDVIWFDEPSKDYLLAYLRSEAKEYGEVVEEAVKIIDGFESPFGMELLATVDWLITRDKVEPTVDAIRNSLENWSGGIEAGIRKLMLFDERSIEHALGRLSSIDGLVVASNRQH